MRPILIVTAAAVAVLAAGAGGHAQESFFSKRYCSMGGSDNSGGMADCSFSTWEQCRAAAAGLARYCAENPYWKPQAASTEARTQRAKKPRD